MVFLESNLEAQEICYCSEQSYLEILNKFRRQLHKSNIKNNRSLEAEKETNGEGTDSESPARLI